MRRSALLPFLLLVAATRTARAEDPDAREAERRTFLARIGMSGGVIEGSRMVGAGSRERFIEPSMNVIDLKIGRIFARKRFGIDLALALMIPTDRYRSLGFAELELAADVLLADGPWGSLIFGVGAGGDWGRYWWEGRGYPLALLRERTWLSRKVRLELESRTIPIAVTGKLPLFEQRFEIMAGVGYFSFGLRFAWTATWGGEPERTYQQHELGAFVGASF